MKMYTVSGFRDMVSCRLSYNANTKNGLVEGRKKSVVQMKNKSKTFAESRLTFSNFRYRIQRS